jgi:hypothetical protein
VANKIMTAAREQYAPAELSFDDADIAAFDPKLPWMVQAGDEAQCPVEGNWRLAACEFVLTRDAGGHGSHNARCAVRIVPSSTAGI